MPDDSVPNYFPGTDKIPGTSDKIGTAESPSTKDKEQDEQAEKDDVKHWLAAIKKASELRDKSPAFQSAKRFLNEYKGNWDQFAQSITIPWVPLNLVFSYVKSEIARLYFRDPWITVNAKRSEDLSAARIAEQVINYSWSELDLKRQCKMAIQEALIVGHSWIKVGYTAEFGTVESRPVEHKKPGRPRKEESVVDTNQFIKSETAFAYHVPYTQVVVDPSATWPVMNSARWIAVEWKKPMRAVKESGIYKNVDKLKDTEEETKEPDKYKDVKMCKGWEIYDLDHMKVVTVSPGCDFYLREIDYPDYLGESLPLVEFSFNPIPGEQYAMSDIAPHEPQIIELSKMLAIMLNHLKRWNRQIFMKPNMMTPENKTNFKQGTDGAVIEIQGDPGKDFFIPPYAPVQQDIYGVWNLCMDMWKNICGQTAMDRGAEGKAATRTVGELRMQLQGSKSRSDEKVDVLEDSIAEVARKLMKVMQTKYDLPKIARIVGNKKITEALQKRPTAQPGNALQPQAFTGDEGFTWNKEDIHGNMDVDVLAGSTAPMDRESQIEQFEKLIPMFPALGVAPGSPPAKAMGREYIRLIGIPSLDPIMDMIEQAPQRPPPKMMEIQMKMKAKQAETQQKMQAKGMESQLKLKGLAAKTQADVLKANLKIQETKADMAMKQQDHHRKMQESVMDRLLKNVRDGVEQ